ncbi:Haloacid dehalogenase, type II [Granulicella sibirica]|uniref:Haloacid dehalogenase, type II n=2 Tax=Granulicella sibirica TaxID=2479048 RepID=A0A4Q0SYU9_9BACT|nr:Haloacid dehalogenase, type II [Granulicella sibirica]
MVRTLRERGTRLAILSNTTAAMMHACVKASGLESAFDFQLSTDHVKAFKPDPSAYQMSLDAFHLRKKEIAFAAFGGWDAVGAKAFGHPTYWVNRFNMPSEELGLFADFTSQNLSSLPSFLKST